MMASRALVVGCDAYPEVADAGLRGAVSDALAMREWLLAADGGQLAEDDVWLLASTSSAGAVPPEGSVRGVATVKQFVKALGELDKLPSTAEDRLFVYFAGHGCQTDPENQALSEDAIVFEDFNDYQPQAGCLGVAALERRLRAMHYGEFFVFVDACRNFPYPQRIPLGGIGFDAPQEKRRAYHPRAHVFQATLPGGEAYGEDTDGVVEGQFTKWLLDGLRGGGEAKTFNPTTSTPQYDVTWDRLRAWVERQLSTQPPRARAEGNPVLCTFADGWFSEIELQVELGPDSVKGRTDLRVLIQYDDADPHGGTIEVVGPTPSRHVVPPRRQRIFANAPGRGWGLQSVDAYVDTVVRLPVPEDAGPLTESAVQARRTTRSGDRRPPKVALRLTANDRAAVVELVDLGGQRIASAVSTVDHEVVAGSYVARVHLPGFPPEEHAVELLGDSSESLEFTVAPEHDSRLWTGSGRPASTLASDPRVLPCLPALGASANETTTFSVQRSRSSPSVRLVPDRVHVLCEGSGVVPAWVFAAEPGDLIDIDGRTVGVPVHPGVHTAVAIPDEAPIVVRLVDRHLVGTENASLLERAQGFLELGRPDYCQILLHELALRGVDSDVGDVLRGDRDLTPHQAAIASTLASNAAPGSALLSTQLWSVTVQVLGDDRQR